MQPWDHGIQVCLVSTACLSLFAGISATNIDQRLPNRQSDLVVANQSNILLI